MADQCSSKSETSCPLDPETVGSCIPDLSPHPIKPKTVKHTHGSGTTHPLSQ